MTSREHIRPRTRGVPAGIIAMLLIFLLLCGCLQIEPEELLPQAMSPFPTTIPVSPTVSANTMENTIRPPPVIGITSPRQTVIFTEQDLPQDIERAVTNFTEGRTTDTINGFLRWESVRARTEPSEKARIQEEIRRIDYAVFNNTLQENITVYVAISGEQAKRIRNELVFYENGYTLASYDPSVIYQQFADSGRDSGGYFTMCVIDLQRGSRFLFLNATEREYLLPHGSIWDVMEEHTYEQMTFSADSIPRYDDIILKKVRLIYMKEHP